MVAGSSSGDTAPLEELGTHRLSRCRVLSRELNKLADPRTATTPRAEAYAMSSEIRTLRAPTLLSKLFSDSEARFHHEPPRGAFGRQSRGLAFFDPLRLGFFDPCVSPSTASRGASASSSYCAAASSSA